MKKRKMNADKITKWENNRYVNAGKQNEAKAKGKRAPLASPGAFSLLSSDGTTFPMVSS